jgi:hypothetical protein
MAVAHDITGAGSSAGHKKLRNAARRVGVGPDMEFGIATFVTDGGIRPGRLGAAVEERDFDSLSCWRRWPPPSVDGPTLPPPPPISLSLGDRQVTLRA